MYKVLDKDTIEMEIVAYIPGAKRGFPPSVPVAEIIDAILYKLKTGVQWHQLPVRALFSQRALTWQGVYYRFNKWCRFLKRHRGKLDLSSADLDGSHTPVLRDDQDVAQGRKKKKTTNSLYLTDRQGLPLAMSEPVAGNRNDLYDIEVQFEVVTATLEKADIPVQGLFLNADAGFDSKDFRKVRGEKEVNANICFNKRTGTAIGTSISTKDCTTSGMPWNAPTHGWTAIARYSTGSTRRQVAGKDSTISRLS